jgi:hypothetical protein
MAWFDIGYQPIHRQLRGLQRRGILGIIAANPRESSWHLLSGRHEFRIAKLALAYLDCRQVA